MTQPAIHSLVLHTIQHVSSDRFQRAVNALAEGSMAVFAATGAQSVS